MGWQAIFDTLVAIVPGDTRSIDSTSIKVQRSAAGGKGGAREQAIGRSRGGRTTKIHGIADSQGRLFRFSLTPGNIADITAAHELAAKLPSNGCLIGDMGYDAKKFRGTASVIPTNPTHKHQWYINRETYKHRTLIERTWCRIKDFRRIATRYTPTVMSVFKGSGREISSAVMFRLPSVMQAGAVEGGN